MDFFCGIDLRILKCSLKHFIFNNKLSRKIKFTWNRFKYNPRTGFKKYLGLFLRRLGFRIYDGVFSLERFFEENKKSDNFVFTYLFHNGFYLQNSKEDKIKVPLNNVFSNNPRSINNKKYNYYGLIFNLNCTDKKEIYCKDFNRVSMLNVWTENSKYISQNKLNKFYYTKYVKKDKMRLINERILGINKWLANLIE